MKKLLTTCLLFLGLNAQANTYIKQGALVEEVTNTATSGGTLLLSATSKTIERFTGVAGHNVNLPNATTLPNGRRFEFKNRSTGTVLVRNFGASTLKTLTAGGDTLVILVDNSTSNGTWDAAAAASSVAGNNTEIQFNDGGVLGASSDLVFDKTTGNFTMSGTTGVWNGIGLADGLRITGTRSDFGLNLNNTGAGGKNWTLVSTNSASGSTQAGRLNFYNPGNGAVMSLFSGTFAGGGGAMIATGVASDNPPVSGAALTIKDGTLSPYSDNNLDLGNSTLTRWRTGYFGTSVHSPSLVLNGSTSGNLTINPAAVTISHTLTMPAAQGAADTFLQNNGSGGLSWVTSSGGITGSGVSGRMTFWDGVSSVASDADLTWAASTNILHLGSATQYIELDNIDGISGNRIIKMVNGASSFAWEVGGSDLVYYVNGANSYSFDGSNMSFNSGTRILNSAGTVASPSYSFGGATDSGMRYNTGGSALNLIEGGVNMVQIDGTTNPYIQFAEHLIFGNSDRDIGKYGAGVFPPRDVYLDRANVMKLVASGPTPEATYQSLYFKTDGKLYKKTNGGVETEIGGGGGGLSGAGVAGRIAYWDGTSSLTSDSGFLFSPGFQQIIVTLASGVAKINVGEEDSAGSKFGGLLYANSASNLGAPFSNNQMVLRSQSGATAGINILTQAAAPITFSTNNANRWMVNQDGNFLANTDNTLDIGASGANRPRTGYFGTNVVAGGDVSAAGGDMFITGANSTFDGFDVTGTAGDLGVIMRNTSAGGRTWYMQSSGAGSGSGAGNLVFGSVELSKNPLKLTSTEVRVQDSHLLMVPHNTYDIGEVSSNRPRTGYFGTSVVVGSTITIDSDSINSSTSLNLKTGGTNVVTIQSPSFSSTLDGKLLLGPNIELYRNTGGEGILQLSPSGGVNGIRSSGGGLEILSNGVARMAVHAGEHWEIKTGSIHIPGTSAQGIKWSIPTGTRPSIISPADATLEFNTGTGSDQKHVFKINTVEKARVDTNGVVTSRVSGLTGSVSTDGDALASSGGSAIQLDFAAAAPTTNTRVTRYSTVTVNTGSPNMTLTQDSDLGDSVKIDKAGVFFVSCTNDDNGTGLDQQACITRNGTALMSTCDNQSTTERLNWSSNTGDKMTFTSWAGYLAVNDVIRCQNAAAPAVGPNFSNFKVHMLSK